MGLLGSVIQPVSAFVFLPTNNRSTHEEGPKEATVVPVMRCCLSCAFLWCVFFLCIACDVPDQRNEKIGGRTNRTRKGMIRSACTFLHSFHLLTHSPLTPRAGRTKRTVHWQLSWFPKKNHRMRWAKGLKEKRGIKMLPFGPWKFLAYLSTTHNSLSTIQLPSPLAQSIQCTCTSVSIQDMYKHRIGHRAWSTCSLSFLLTFVIALALFSSRAPPFGLKWLRQTEDSHYCYEW